MTDKTQKSLRIIKGNFYLNKTEDEIIGYLLYTYLLYHPALPANSRHTPSPLVPEIGAQCGPCMGVVGRITGGML